ncbi:MAG: hypothetical protein R3234_07530, partial [Thermoanaerobaculia bacterium]|nr:hypothetical protein [Thermoanaerobaculia bacterium]
MRNFRVSLPSLLRLLGLGSRGWKVVGVAAVGLLLPWSVIAEVDVEVLPEAPLWDEPLTIRVEDSDDCATHALSEPEIGFDSSLGRFTVDLDLSREA